MQRFVGPLLAGAAVCLGPSLVLAQEQPPSAAPSDSGVISYPPEFFADNRPSNANDMIARLPGFSLNKGADVRGFGGAGGNVLIDGQRPSSKSVALDQLLQRIPVSQVERIDLIRGGAPGVDMQGHSVVANVVRKGGSTSTRTAMILFKPYTDGFVGTVPRLEYTWRSGGLSAEAVLGGRYDYHPDTGDGSIHRSRASGLVYEDGAFDTQIDQRNIFGNGAAEYRAGRDTVRINAGFDRNDLDRVEISEMIDLGRTPFTERSRVKSRNDKAEVGADYTRELNGAMTAQVLGLHTLKRDKQDSSAASRAPRQESYELAEVRETIVRAALVTRLSSGATLETGAEGALNVLQSRSSLTVGGTPVAVPSANVRVEEQRAEAFATLTTTLAGIGLEAGMRFERSTIGQDGVAQNDKTLSFAKPRLIATFNPLPAHQVRLRVERTVGQLNFKDFAASSALEAGTVNAGNPDIEPERGWLVEATVERQFWGRGAVVVSFSRTYVEEVVDLIPVGGRFDAPGNIGDGTRDELKVNLNAPLDRLGVPGGMIIVNGTWRWSEVVDPVTGKTRRISGQRPYEGSFIASKAFPSLKSNLVLDVAWGYVETFYRISEIRRNQDQPLLKLYWDWAPSEDLNFRFQIENFTAKERKRDRTLFTGPRSLEQVAFRETRGGRLDPFLMARMRKTF